MEADVVITAAVIPGKKSPVLITEAMVKRMAPGSVIVDLAAERLAREAVPELVNHLDDSQRQPQNATAAKAGFRRSCRAP